MSNSYEHNRILEKLWLDEAERLLKLSEELHPGDEDDYDDYEHVYDDDGSGDLFCDILDEKWAADARAEDYRRKAQVAWLSENSLKIEKLKDTIAEYKSRIKEFEFLMAEAEKDLKRVSEEKCPIPIKVKKGF